MLSLLLVATLAVAGDFRFDVASGSCVNEQGTVGLNRSATPGPCVDLSGADLRGRDLSHVDLRGARLVNADLRGADLSFADLSRAVLTGAKLNGPELACSTMVETNIDLEALRRASRAGCPSAPELASLTR